MPGLAVPIDGRLTSQNVLASPTGDSVLYIVSPGNETTGNSYQVTLATLAAYFTGQTYETVLVTTGATVGDPYVVQAADGRVLLQKSVPSASYVECPLAADVAGGQAILIKDHAGNSDTYPITVTFTGGELCDGLTEVVISNPYGWVWVAPSPNGGSWYML